MIQKVTFIFFMFIFFINSLFALSFSKVETKKYNLIYAKGRIHYGDLYKFKKIYKSSKTYKQTIVILSSNGGVMEEGIKLGKYFYSKGIGTAVKSNSICVSSCALAFLGGRDLYGNRLMILQPNTKIGFHKFYYKNRAYVSQRQINKDLSKVVNYFYDVNAPDKLMYKMLQTKSNKMFWVSNRIHKRYLHTKRINLEKDIKYALSYKRKSLSYLSKKEAIKKYFKDVNIAINEYKSRYKNNSALNANSYEYWLNSKLNYVYAKNLKIENNNIVRVNVVYGLKNGKRVYSKNIYKLQRTQYGWRIVAKEIKPYKKYKSLVKGLEGMLP